MDLRQAIAQAAKNKGLAPNLVGWRLDSGLSSQGRYIVSDLSNATSYHPSIDPAQHLTQAEVLAGWVSIMTSNAELPAGADEASAWGLSADKTTIDADGVDEAVITITPPPTPPQEGGETMKFVVVAAGEIVASGVNDDGTIELSASSAAVYTVRVVDAAGKYREIEVEAV